MADSDVLPNDTIYLKLTTVCPETLQLSNEELNPAKLKWFPASQDRKLLQIFYQISRNSHARINLNFPFIKT